MDLNSNIPIHRRIDGQTTACAVIAVFLTIHIVLLLASNHSLIGSLLLSPVAAFGTIISSGLVVGFAALVALRIFLMEGLIDPQADGFQKLLSAVIIGLTPHVIFLMLLNSPTTRHLVGDPAEWEHHINAYEEYASLLQEKYGDYLLPSFFAGAAISIVMWILTARHDRPQTRKAWETVRDTARFAGLVLLSATTFTAATAIPGGDWQPDSRRALEVRLAKKVRLAVILSIYQQTAEQFASPNNKLPQAIIAAWPNIKSVGSDNYDAAVRKILPSSSAQQNKALLPDRPFTVESSGAEARRQVDEIGSDLRNLGVQIEVTRKDLAGLIGSAVGSSAELFTDKLVAALIEELSTKIAEEILSRSQNARDVINWMARRPMPDTSAPEIRAKISSTFDAIAKVLRDGSAMQTVSKRVIKEASEKRQAEIAEQAKRRIEFRK
jgi:hypothetical protein